MRTLLILTVLLKEQARNLLIPPALSGGLSKILNRMFGHTAENNKVAGDDESAEDTDSDEFLT